MNPFDDQTPTLRFRELITGCGRKYHFEFGLLPRTDALRLSRDQGMDCSLYFWNAVSSSINTDLDITACSDLSKTCGLLGNLSDDHHDGKNKVLKCLVKKKFVLYTLLWHLTSIVILFLRNLCCCYYMEGNKQISTWSSMCWCHFYGFVKIWTRSVPCCWNCRRMSYTMLLKMVVHCTFTYRIQFFSQRTGTVGHDIVQRLLSFLQKMISLESKLLHTISTLLTKVWEYTDIYNLRNSSLRKLADAPEDLLLRISSPLYNGYPECKATTDYQKINTCDEHLIRVRTDRIHIFF